MGKRGKALILVAVGALALSTAHAAVAAPAAPRWLREVGNHYWQYGSDVAVDGAGNAWVVGSTSGKFPKSGVSPSQRATTAFLAQYNRRGGIAWSTQFGTTHTAARSIVRDTSGNVDVVGVTSGPDGFPGTEDHNAGSSDAFIRQYDADGNHAWTHLIGSSAGDSALGVAADANGDVYVVGITQGHMPDAPEEAHFENDGWIAKYTVDGARAWVHQLGTDSVDELTAVVASPGGGVDVAGDSTGDAVVAHYDSDGTRTWMKQIGSAAYELVGGIAADASGNIFVVGETPGALPGWSGKPDGYGDAFLLELDSAGNQLAVEQFGTKDGFDDAYAVAVDALGDVFVTGSTAGQLRGAPEPNEGFSDAFVARFTPATNHAGFRTAWVHQIGSIAFATGQGIASTAGGTVTMVGYANDRLPNAVQVGIGGEADAIVARFSRVS